MNAKPPRRRRVLLRLGTLIAVSYLLYGCTLSTMQERLIFPREIPGVRNPHAAVPPRWEQLTVQPEPAITVPAWLRLPKSPSNSPPFPCIIWIHGNAEVIDDCARYPQLEIYDKLGVAVLLVELRGYGRAGGEPSQKAITSDMVAFYDQLAKRPDIDPARIAFYGRSLGGGIACALAESRPPKALILQSTFTSINAMAARFLIPSFLVRHPFQSDRFVESFPGPILLMHGTADEIIPFSHGQTLAKLAKNGRLYTQDCDHNDFPIDLKGYETQIEAFLRQSGILQGSGQPAGPPP